MLLKEVTESFKVERGGEKQQFKFNHDLSGVIKNKDLFMQAQLKPKQTDWFSRMNQPQDGAKRETSGSKNNRMGLTKEEEIQLGLDLIPMWKEKESELLVKQEKIKTIKGEIQQLSREQGAREKRVVHPQVTTSFMAKKSTAKRVQSSDREDVQ